MNIFNVNSHVFDEFLASDNKDIKTCFVSTYTPNPRLTKRIDVFAQYGGGRRCMCKKAWGKALESKADTRGKLFYS